MTNKEVEEAAIAFVIDYERQHGRLARDTRHRGAPGDVESDGRIIEVKASGGSARGQDLWLEVRQVEEGRSNPEFHVYVVDNVRQGDPARFGLIDLHGEVLATMLARAREQRYFTVPFPTSCYDALIKGEPPHSGDIAKAERPVPPAVEDGGQPGTTGAAANDPATLPRTRAIEWVLDHNDGPMTPVEVWATLRRLGRQHDPKGDVSTTTYDLWRAGRIDRVSRGLYQSLRPRTRRP